MWKPEHRLAADRRGLRYPSDLTELADQPDRQIFSGRRRDEFELTKMR